jgi:hypothetical protein
MTFRDPSPTEQLLAWRVILSLRSYQLVVTSLPPCIRCFSALPPFLTLET